MYLKATSSYDDGPDGSPSAKEKRARRSCRLSPAGRDLYPMNMKAASVAQPSVLQVVAPGPATVLESSSGLSWHGFLVERHRSVPGERAAGSIDHHVISVLDGGPSRGEYRVAGRSFVPTVKRPGAITIMPSGLVPEMHLFTPSELIHCALNRSFVNGVAAEMDRTPSSGPKMQSGIYDPATSQIVHLLRAELRTGGALGRLYAESLAQALVIRLLTFGTQASVPEMRISALPKRVLASLCEWIEMDLPRDFSLDELARFTGYSRAHFVRMFRAATGLTPHQFVLTRRIERAKLLLRQRETSLIDIAAICGFSSQSHMTNLFRQHVGTTPANYRRNL